MMKELKSHEPYEVSPGCPTISFDLGQNSLMFSYSSFASGNFTGGRIELNFQDWLLEIDGRNLDEVWRLLQMQDLRCVCLTRENQGADISSCQIHAIAMTKIAGK